MSKIINKTVFRQQPENVLQKYALDIPWQTQITVRPSSPPPENFSDPRMLPLLGKQNYSSKPLVKFPESAYILKDSLALVAFDKKSV